MESLWHPYLFPFSLPHTQLGQMGQAREAMGIRGGVGAGDRRKRGGAGLHQTRDRRGLGVRLASFAGLSPFNSFIVITLKMPLYIE